MSTPYDNPQVAEQRRSAPSTRNTRRRMGQATHKPQTRLKGKARQDAWTEAVGVAHPKEAPKGRWLYRMYAADDTLLYVGITDRGHTREREHRRTKSWFAEVHHMTYQRYTTRAELEHAERVAIKGEHPRYNVIHNTNSGPLTSRDKSRYRKDAIWG